MMFHDWLLTPQRVAIHIPTATAVAADLHLGYQEARRLCGDAVPHTDMETNLAPLFIALDRGKVKNLIIAGDLFEKAFDPKLWQELKSRLANAHVQFLGLIPGNHDRGLEKASLDLPLLPNGHVLEGWSIHHGDGPLPQSPVVLGHLHPAVPYRGRQVPCYLLGERRLVLPAYSQDAAGFNVLTLRSGNYCRCLAIAAGKLFELQRIGQ
jgi:putative SbcD/Mre11-related phosphoesterase